MLKVGLAENLVNTRFSPTALARASYLTAVATGMDSFWLPDHLNSLFPRAAMTKKFVGSARLIPDADAHLEPWTVLGNFAAQNRIGRLRLGVGVTDTGRRNPAVTAQAAATLHLITRGRAILGIGAGEREGNEPYGVDWSKPVARFEEAMATIRALWNSGGELVTRDSPFFPLHNATFAPAALPWQVAGNLDRRSWATHVAGHRPLRRRMVPRGDDPAKGLRGRPGKGPSRRLRRRAGSVIHHRRQLFFVVTGASRGEVDDALGSTAMKAFVLNVPAEVWARHGARHPLGDDFSGGQDIIPQVFDEQTVLSYTADVPISIAKEFFLTGTPDEVIEQAAEWRDCGMDYPVLANISAVQPSMRRGFAANVPFVRILRQLRRL